MSNIKQRESLRCLFASVASMEVIDWLLKSDRYKGVIADARDIDEKLSNIRSFFAVGIGFTKQEVQYHFLPVGSALTRHIYGVLFADAVRWWAAAHRTGQDKSKYLRDAMYKGEFVALFHHFYHDFRNNQLAHFPGGSKSNDNPFLTPIPYGFLMSTKEFEDFRTLLAHSIWMAMVGVEKLEERGPEDIFSEIEEADVVEELKEAAISAIRKRLRALDLEILKIPTRNYLPDEDD